MIKLFRFAACLVVSIMICTVQAEPVPSDAFGLYSGTGKGTSVLMEPGNFKVSYFLEIIDATTAELIYIQDGQAPSSPITGRCFLLEPNFLLLKFEINAGNVLSGTFMLKGKPGAYSLKGNMITMVDGFIGTTVIRSKFKQNPD